MESNIVHILNNKLHNFKYLNYTIIFYIILLYTYYSLFVYLLNKNYIMLLLYFTFFILLDSSYKNFTYFIGFVILIIFRVFNIDNIVNSNSIDLVNKFNTNKIESFGLVTRIKEKANEEGDSRKKDAQNNRPAPNPCKSYIINKVQQLGITISNKGYNHKNKEASTRTELNNILKGHYDVPQPTFYTLNSK